MTAAGMRTVTSLQGTVAEGAGACSKLPGAGRIWHETGTCRMQAPCCCHTSLQQPPCLLTVADWVKAETAAGMQPWLVTPGRACLLPVWCLLPGMGHGQL